MKTKKILFILFCFFSSVLFSANALAEEHEFTLTVKKGAADLLVNVNCYVFNEGGSYLSISGTTDANGEVSFDLSEGTYRIRVDYLGYQFWTEVYDVPAILSDDFTIDHQDVAITVEESYQGSSDPIEGIKVYLFTASGSYVGQSQVTDPGGQVTFNLPEQSYKVRADFLGQQFWSETFTWQDTIVSIPMADAEITVTGAGLPQDGVNVYVFSGTGSYLSVSGTTDTEGKVLFRLAAGAYKFRADYESSQYWSGNETLIANQVNPIAISAGGGLFNLTVLKGAADPLVGVNCYVFSEGGSYLSISGTTDENGHVSFDLSEGTYRIRVDYLGYQFWTEVYDVPTTLSDEFTIDHQDVIITVEGTYQGSSDPIEGIKLYLFTASGSYVSRSQVTDPDGQVTFNLPEQSYKVRADFLGQQFWSEAFTWQDTTVNIPMADAEITVTGAGLPQEGVKVYVFSGSGSYLSVSGTTDTEGKVLFRLAAGTYKFRADYEGSHYWSGDETLIADQVNPIAVSVGGGLFNLTVLKGAADPLVSVNCYVFNESGSYLSISGTTDENGQVSFDLSEGTYRIRVDYLGYQFWTEVYDVPTTLSDEFTIVHQDAIITVEGTYQGSSDPIEGIKVYLFTASGSYVSRFQVTDPGGQATFNLPEQSYKVCADYLGQQFWSEAFTWMDVSVVIAHGLAHIHVTRSGADLEGANVYLFAESGSYLSRSQTTDTSGVVEFLVPAGSYTFRVDQGGDQRWSAVTPITADLETDVEIEMEEFFPTVSIVEPDGVDDIADLSFTIQWTDDDPDDNATISLFYDNDNAGEDGTLIVSGINEDPDGPENDEYVWNTSAIADGAYYVYAVIDDGKNDPVVDYSEGVLTIDHTSSIPGEVKLTASDAEADDWFGYWADIDGDYVIVGSPWEDENGEDSGAAYIFKRNENTWTEQAKLVAGDAQERDLFGISVSIDGDYAIVGAGGDDNDKGAAYVFRLEGAAWVEQVKLTAVDAQEGDSFGSSVSIDGDYALVGAGGDDNYKGAAYIFRLEGAAWVEQAKLTASDAGEWSLFGSSVSVCGEYAVIGAYYADYGLGAAYIFNFDGDTWTEQAKLTASDAGEMGFFANSVSICGEYAVIGSPYGNYFFGAAYIFNFDGDTWAEQAKLTASDAGEWSLFGSSVSIDGNYVIVGAGSDENEKGAAYIFRLEGAAWSEQTKLTASDGEEYDSFGIPVAINAPYVIVGASGNDEKGTDSGTAYIYQIEGWTPPPELSVSAIPENILLGESSTLAWDSTNADSVIIDQGIGAVDLDGTISVFPNETTTYTVIATGTGGTTTDSVTVCVVDPNIPPTVAMNATQGVIEQGDATTLTWMATNASFVSIDQGIGDVPMIGSITVYPNETTTYTITATNSAGTDTDSATIYVIDPNVLPTASISAAPVGIELGGSSTLTWTATNASTVSIDHGIGEVPMSGSISVSPTETTIYTITASNPAGTDTDSASVYIIDPDVPPTVNMNGTPTTIVQGLGSTLTWTATNAASVSIDQGIGEVPMSGSLTIYPEETTTYTITVTNPTGTDTDSVNIKVYGPSDLPIVSMSATPQTIDRGSSSTLSWTSSDADSVHIDNGIGVVSSNGSTVVSPTHTTTYTITVTNPAGTVSSQTTVTVLWDPEPQPERSFGEQYEDLIPPDATVEEYDPKRFSVVTGLVRDIHDLPIPDVSVSILNRLEYGTALTDLEGRFSIPVDGGETITFVYQKEGFLAAQRKVSIPWNDIAIAETIQMIPEDPAATTVLFDGNPDTVVTHQSTPVSDEFGSRSCSMVFTGDNRIYLVDEEGNYVQELTTITTRATEYATPDSMPAILPPNSAYTYCVELSVDGVQRVRFEKPVIIWVDNFLGFEVGEVVPVGFYDRDRGVWVPSDNGVVVKLLDTDSDGIVEALDADGDDQPDDLDNNGSFSNEVIGLDDTTKYPPNSTFWRVAVVHFTSWDFNWPFGGPPPDAVPPNTETLPYADQQMKDDPKRHICSYVEERSRIFHEDIPIPGTDMTLHYASNRVQGYKTGIIVPASGASVPGSLKQIIVHVCIAGNIFYRVLDPLPNQQLEFLWDGLEWWSQRPVNRPTTAHMRIGYVYDPVFYRAREDLFQSFAQAGVEPFPFIMGNREPIVVWYESELVVYPPTEENGVIAEGWTLSSHHNLSLANRPTLSKGDGTRAEDINFGYKLRYWGSSSIETVAGTGAYGYSGDGGPATEATFTSLNGIVVDAEGNIYIADKWSHCVRKVDTGGIITTVAGNGTEGSGGDGGPAIEAQLFRPCDVAIDSSGNLYIADAGLWEMNRPHLIRKVDTNGIITTVAGAGFSSEEGIPAIDTYFESISSVETDKDGNIYVAEDSRIRKISPSGMINTVAGILYADGYSGDGGPAIEALLDYPQDMALDDQGNLYIADTYNHCVRKVDPSGTIITIAGNGTEGYSGDEGLATGAQLNNPSGIALDDSGNIYISDTYNHYIRKVDTTGIISTVAGNETGTNNDGQPATMSRLSEPSDVALDPSGRLYIADEGNFRLRTVGAPSPYDFMKTNQGMTFVEEDGLGHVLSDSGLLEKTIDLDAGIVLRTFQYNQDNQLISITDRFDNVITIQRDADGVPTTIISPDGLVTTLTIDQNNHLTRITYPDGNYYGFEYAPDGLTTAKTEPGGNRFEHVFNTSGRITDFTDDEGGHWQFSKTIFEDGDVLAEVLTAEDNLTSYLDHTYSSGAYTSTVTDPTDSQTLITKSADGLIDNKSLPCGTELETVHGVDSLYKFDVVKETIETTPSSLAKVTIRDKTYEDTNQDGTPDLTTETVTVNAKATILENYVLKGQKTVTSPEGRTVTTLYDPLTLLTESISILGLYDTSYGYDVRGRLTSIVTNTRETSFSYNPQGFFESVTDSENNTTSYTYDEVGRVTWIDRPDETSIGFDYDGNGNMTLLINPSSIEHGFGFNMVNKKSSYQTPLGGDYSYLYDKDRRLIRTTFPSGAQINNIYDTTQPIQIQTPEGNIDFTYLCSTNVDSVTNGIDTITYGYDGKLVTSETLSGTLNESLGYTYNNDFNVTSFTYAGSTTNYLYDNDGLLTGAGGFTVSRNAGNGLPESVIGGSFSLSRTLNGYGEVDSQDFTVSSQSLASWSLTRDDNGRITQKTETVDGFTSNYVYTYDPMGRLLTVTKDGGLVEEYEYSLNGTRIYEMNTLRGIAGRTLTYSDEDHLLTAGSVTYEYDLDGFLTTKTDGADVTTYDYSSRGELLSVTLPDGTLVEYVHDPLGRRIAKKVDGVTVEKYLWQGLTTLLAVFDGSNNLLMRFEYADSRMPISMMRSDGTYYFTYDQVFSLRVVADSSGNAVKIIDYDSFGNIINDTNPSFEVSFGFAGGLYDKDTNLVRFGYRDYDPNTGRWTAKDPIRFAGGDTDLYGYVQNDPVNLIDPWGLLSTGQNFTISAVSTMVTLVASTVATPVVGAALGGAVAFGVTLAAGGSMNEAITNGLMSSVGALAFPFAKLGEVAMAVRPGAYALGLMGEFGMDLLTTKIPPIPLFADHSCE